MINARHVVSKSARLAGLVLAVVAVGALPASRAHAQTGDDSVAARSGSVDSQDSETSLRRSLQRLDDGRIGASRRTWGSAFEASSAGRRRSTGRKVAGGVIGAVGGFFAGGFLGAAIEGNRCDCDDPGLRGFIVGAPIGAVVAGILGGKYF